MLKNGKIIKINSDIFTVKVENELIDTKSRGKLRRENIKPMVGDLVKVDTDKKTIEEVYPRKNYLLRPIVANIDVALIVTSLKIPNLNLNLLDKLISIVTIHNIRPIIVFTKLDLANKKELKEIKELSKYYKSIGIEVFDNKKIKKLKTKLKGLTVTVCGQTGAGKSTLINKLDSNLKLAVGDVSMALGRGKHTTRIVELFEVGNFYIVDTPGFSSLDLENYSKEEIKNSFKEFQKVQCRFKDCFHENEKDCEVIELVKKGKIKKSRYDNYIRFIKEKK